MAPVIILKNKCSFDKPSLPSSELYSNIIACKNEFQQQENHQSKSSEKCYDDDHKIYINISNVTACFNVKSHLNLRYIALHGHNIEYRRETGKLNMKLRKPQTTAIIWSSGKIICVGCLSEYEAKIASRRIARKIQRLGYTEIKFSNYRVVNVVGSCTLPFSIRISQFSEKYKSNAQYEPELHPAVVYRPKTFKATMKIFSTGSISINAPSEALVCLAIEHIYPLVLPFAIDNKIVDDRRLEMIQRMKEQKSAEKDDLSMYYCPIGDLIRSGHLNTLMQ